MAYGVWLLALVLALILCAVQVRWATAPRASTRERARAPVRGVARPACRYPRGAEQLLGWRAKEHPCVNAPCAHMSACVRPSPRGCTCALHLFVTVRAQ